MVVVGISGPAIAAALTLSLAVMAAISLVLLRRGLGSVTVAVEPGHVRIFKGETASTVLRVQSGSGQARVSMVALQELFGMKSELSRFERRSAELRLTPHYAGRFAGLSATVTLTDVLGLYSHSAGFALDMSVDSLPRALLLPESPLPVSPLIQGEVPIGGRGSGQELYSVEPYAPGSDAKDVMWRRLARFEDERMQVRIREASAKSTVTVLCITKDMSAEEETRRTDQASEAVAQLGKRLISMGVVLEVAHSHNGETSFGRATNTTELASAIMQIWKRTGDKAATERALVSADLLVFGQEMLQDARLRAFIEEKPILLLGEWAGRSWSGTRIFSFSAQEDLSQLAEVLLER